MSLAATVQKRYDSIRESWERSISGALPLTASQETVTTQTVTVKSWAVLAGVNAGNFILTPGSGTALTIPLGVGELANSTGPVRMAGGFTVSSSVAGMTLDLVYER